MEYLNGLFKIKEAKGCPYGQHSSWSDIVAGVPQGSIHFPLLFLIYINDLSDGLQCNPKLFADDTSLFSTVHDINEATVNLNNDLIKITKWAFQWKMSFNPDISKQANEVIFSINKILTINNNSPSIKL